jgi:hypothetical protein
MLALGRLYSNVLLRLLARCTCPHASCPRTLLLSPHVLLLRQLAYCASIMVLRLTACLAPRAWAAAIGSTRVAVAPTGRACA